LPAAAGRLQVQQGGKKPALSDVVEDSQDEDEEETNLHGDDDENEDYNDYNADYEDGDNCDDIYDHDKDDANMEYESRREDSPMDLVPGNNVEFGVPPLAHFGQ
jgi:hypothetical protein